MSQHVGTGFSNAVTPSRLFAVGRAEAYAIECAESDSPFQRYITGVVHDSGVTHDTRYDAWEFGGFSWCHGAVQEKDWVPSEGSRTIAKLDRGERPPTGQSEEALWFRCRFRPDETSSATEVPLEGSERRV